MGKGLSIVTENVKVSFYGKLNKKKKKKKKKNIVTNTREFEKLTET
jgi:hypothetical protein